jgi:glycine/D-amino acid oxidase-like deaminating enzyme
MMTPDEVKARWPYLCMDGIIGVAFCGDDGHINPQTLTLSYGHAARRLGATVKTYCPVVKLLAENGKIKGVVTEDGEECMRLKCSSLQVLGRHLLQPLSEWNCRYIRSVTICS